MLTHFESLVYSDEIRRRRQDVKPLTQLCRKKLKRLLKCVPPKNFSCEIAVYLDTEALLKYLKLRFGNRLFQLERSLKRRCDFIRVYDTLLRQSVCAPSLSMRKSIVCILESYESESFYQLNAVPQVMYQRGMLGQSKLRYGCGGSVGGESSMSGWLKRLLWCQHEDNGRKIELVSDPPKILESLKPYVVEISDEEYSMLWTRDSNPVVCVFAQGSFPVGPDHPNYLTSVEQTAERLVWVHKYVKEWRLSEALAMLLCCWIPHEMVQKIEFFTLLLKVGAHLGLKIDLQCKLVNLACECVGSEYRLEFEKCVLGPSVLTCFLRWGHFSLMEMFYARCFSASTAKSVYEVESARLMAESYVERVENVLLFIAVFRRYHKNCGRSLENLPCVNKVGCCRQFQEVDACLEKLGEIISFQDHYMKGMYYFLKYVRGRLWSVVGEFDDEKNLSVSHFRMSTKWESKIMCKFWDGKIVEFDDVKYLLDREKEYYCVDLRLAQLLVKYFLMELVMFGGESRTSGAGKIERYLCKDALRYYRAATHGRSYRIPLLKMALNIFVLHARHFSLAGDDTWFPANLDASFDECDVVMDESNRGSLPLLDSLCEINNHQKEIVKCNLMPNLENLKDCPPALHDTTLDALNAFFLSDPSVLGRHLYYALQQTRPRCSREFSNFNLSASSTDTTLSPQ